MNRTPSAFLQESRFAVLVLALLTIPLLFLLCGCASQRSLQTSIEVSGSSGQYRVTLPSSDVALKFPKGGLIRTHPQDVPDPGYFCFEDGQRRLRVSGWLITGELYPGIQALWEDNKSRFLRKGLPEPKQVSFHKQGIWDIVRYSMGGPNLWASAVSSRTWINLHLTASPATVDGYERLQAFLAEIEVEAKKIDPEVADTYLDDTRVLVSQGKYREALRRYAWFNEHIIEGDSKTAFARLPLALHEWKALGDVYAPAKQALVKTRDRKEQQLRDNSNGYHDFTDVQRMKEYLNRYGLLFLNFSSLNRILEENNRTMELFDHLNKENIPFAIVSWDAVRDLAVAAKRQDLVRRYANHPMYDFGRVRKAYHENVMLYEHPQVLKPHFKASNEELFVRQSVSLVQAALMLGDNRTARKIQREAQAMIDDDRLRYAIPADKSEGDDPPSDEDRNDGAFFDRG